jgi:hypothetical protein
MDLLCAPDVISGHTVWWSGRETPSSTEAVQQLTQKIENASDCWAQNSGVPMSSTGGDGRLHGFRQEMHAARYRLRGGVSIHGRALTVVLTD